MREPPWATRVRASCLAAAAEAGRSTGLAAALVPGPAAAARVPGAARLLAAEGRVAGPVPAAGRGACLHNGKWRNAKAGHDNGHLTTTCTLAATFSA